MSKQYADEVRDSPGCFGSVSAICLIIIFLWLLTGCADKTPDPAFCWDCTGLDIRVLDAGHVNVTDLKDIRCIYTETQIKGIIKENTVTRPDLGFWRNYDCKKAKPIE